MKIAIITDTHINHDKVIEYDGRHENHAAYALMALRKSSADVLIHLGDVAFGGAAAAHQLLTSAFAGKRWLILGNHDENSLTWHIKNGWDFVSNELVLDYMNYHITFTHKPVECVGINRVNIHGHLHKSTCSPNHMGLHLPDNDYKPYDLDRLIRQHRKTLKHFLDR